MLQLLVYRGGLNRLKGTTTSGEYSTISAAVASLSGTSSACIFVYQGTYSESFTVSYGGPLTIYGYTTRSVWFNHKLLLLTADTSGRSVGSYKSNTVTVTHTISSADAGSLDASSTMNVKSAKFNMYNINVKNGYGKGAQVC